MNRGIVALGASILAAWILGGQPAKGGEVRYSKQTYTYKTVGDCKIKADVYRMPGEEVRPAILWIHGGALIMGQRGFVPRDQLARYLDAGFTLVSIDYRLAPETKVKGIIEDLQHAYAWLRSQGPRLFKIDPDRIAVIGHSAGGYLTLMAGFCVKPRPKALVAFYGYGDIAGKWYSRPDPFYCKRPAVPKEEAYKAVGGPVVSEVIGPNTRRLFYLYCRQQGLWPREVAGFDPHTEPRAFDPYCPERNVTRDYPPTLLLHGDRDTDVPYKLSVQMADALKKQGVEHKLITVKNGGHGFDWANGGLRNPANAERFERVLEFLKQHTK
ncbi:MAG: alpha/beta hydrolase [Candidatus Brocadiae bacterium]|nr:alpha/beta hydrolase [Candidatus Brocadiia bacterium]